MKQSKFSQYQAGQRIRLVRMDNDPRPIPVGTEGTITSVRAFNDWAQLSVDWDNGSTLMACLPEDKVEILK